ncbi:MAG: hypothetical protein ACR2FH_00695 [Caulobacteraceae bacterium]
MQPSGRAEQAASVAALDNPRHEVFAAALARGEAPGRAWLEAGYGARPHRARSQAETPA